MLCILLYSALETFVLGRYKNKDYYYYYYFGYVTIADVTIHFFNRANAITVTMDVIEYCIYDYNGTLNDNQARQLSPNYY